MATALVTLAAGLASLLVWWIQRRSQQKADPAAQNKERYEQIDQDIRKALRSGKAEDALRASAHGGNDLDELERLQRSHGDQRRSN